MWVKGVYGQTGKAWGVNPQCHSDPASWGDRGVGSNSESNADEPVGVDSPDRTWGDPFEPPPVGGILSQLIESEDDRLAELEQEMLNLQARILQARQRRENFVLMRELCKKEQGQLRTHDVTLLSEELGKHPPDSGNPSD